MYPKNFQSYFQGLSNFQCNQYLKTKDIQGAPPIFYVTPVIYELTTEFMGLKKIYAETLINLPKDAWIKYTNNQAHFDKNHYYMTSFSHFTYEESKGLLVVTDLQGKRNILSDPSIQTIEQFNLNLISDETNCQTIGIGQFLFSQHEKCNQICQQLGLKNQKQDQNIDKTMFDNNQQVVYICEICDEYREMSFNEYKQTKSFRCELCFELAKKNESFQCNCCMRVFEIPYEIFIKSGTNITSCDDCKKICEKNKNFPFKCYYCEIECQICTKERQIGNQKVYLCDDSMNYLNQLLCIKCNKKKYDKSKLIDKKSYLKGEYVCYECSK